MKKTVLAIMLISAAHMSSVWAAEPTARSQQAKLPEVKHPAFAAAENVVDNKNAALGLMVKNAPPPEINEDQGGWIELPYPTAAAQKGSHLSLPNIEIRMDASVGLYMAFEDAEMYSNRPRHTEDLFSEFRREIERTRPNRLLPEVAF